MRNIMIRSGLMRSVLLSSKPLLPESNALSGRMISPSFSIVGHRRGITTTSGSTPTLEIDHEYNETGAQNIEMKEEDQVHFQPLPPPEYAQVDWNAPSRDISNQPECPPIPDASPAIDVPFTPELPSVASISLFDIPLIDLPPPM